VLIKPICKGKGIQRESGNYKGISLFAIFGENIFSYDSLYRVSQEECARLQESVPYVKVY